MKIVGLIILFLVWAAIRRRRRQPINVVKGLILPHPGDDVWETVPRQKINEDRLIMEGFKTGKVTVVLAWNRHHHRENGRDYYITTSNDLELWVGDTQIDTWTARYQKAVMKQQKHRFLQAAIDESPLLGEMRS